MTVLAGTLDAAAYIELNHLYVSFMSGNSTHLGMVLAAGALPDILAVITIILAFVVGASVGTFIADRAGRHMPTAVLGAEALLVLIAVVLALCGGAHTALVLIAIAMGAQNVLHQVIAGADVGKGFITGALFGLGQSVARLFRDEGAAARSASNMLSWCAFVGGAAAGTLCLASLGLVGCLVAAAFLILVLLIAALARWL
nr:YoaK family protein [Ancylobacter sp. Lp-2]